MISRIKLVAALVLLSCFALPMSSCTQWRDANGSFVLPNPDKAMPAGVHAVTTQHYALERVEIDIPSSWLLPAALVWPLLFVLIARKYAKSRVVTVLWFLEPLLVGGSALMIFLAVLIEHVEIGSYIGWAALALYLLGWIWEAWNKWRTWRRNRSLPAHSA